MGKLRTIFNRIYADYLMPSRLREYEEIIQSSLSEGFIHITYAEYVQKLKNSMLNSNEKYFILRHDVDTDVATAKRFFKIEKKLHVKASYYFRQNTIDLKLMREINTYGSEASYHFEELAAFCKNKHIKNKDDAIARIHEIRQLFKSNFIKLEKKLGYKLNTVASHGDFVNRKLNLINNIITDDINLRNELGILAETYDKDIFNSFDAYISDKPYPKYYTKSVFESITKNRVICFLTHPRHWHTNVCVNTKDNMQRFVEGIVW